MPAPEIRRTIIPEWAQRERAQDLEWISENLHVFWPAAAQGFAAAGRGAIVSDATTLVTHEGGQSHPFFYLPQLEIEQQPWREVIRMVRSYDPSWELVTVLLKRGRESAYRIGVPTQKK